MIVFIEGHWIDCFDSVEPPLGQLAGFPPIAIDVSASQFPQLPVPRHSPEQVGGRKATNGWLKRYPSRQHGDLHEYAHDRLSSGRKNYSTVSRDPGHRL